MKRSLIFIKSPMSIIKIERVPCDLSVNYKILSHEKEREEQKD